MRKQGAILFILAILLCACTTYSKKSSGVRHVYGIHRSEKVHVVRRNETLYSIAWEAGLDYRAVAKMNHLNASYRIHKGQKLVLKSSRHKYTWKPKTKKTTYAKRSIIVIPSPVEKETLHWRWPVRGRLLACFSPYSMMNKGIDIAAKKGTPVLAAAPGKVVYSGNGLKGYGHMVIIKHNPVYLSAYAHNRRLWVKEGMFVKGGQKIAEVGNSDSRQVVLHFEIRRAGKPVNPLLFLK